MYKPDVTLAILNYNRSEYLDRALRSCLDQSMSGITHEVIVIDDNSTDDSMKYLKSNKLIKNYIRVFKNKKNMGPGYCSRLAVIKSRGKFFMRVDSDDYLNRFAIDIMTNILKNNQEYGYVYCDHYKSDEFGIKQGIVKLNNKKKF